MQLIPRNSLVSEGILKISSKIVSIHSAAGCRQFERLISPFTSNMQHLLRFASRTLLFLFLPTSLWLFEQPLKGKRIRADGQWPCRQHGCFPLVSFDMLFYLYGTSLEKTWFFGSFWLNLLEDFFQRNLQFSLCFLFLLLILDYPECHLHCLTFRQYLPYLFSECYLVTLRLRIRSWLLIKQLILILASQLVQLRHSLW